ncbi:unnamed protein product [Rhizoctonia solani]|uniref:BTB domain-containing protein n=1 Tax=Rhizoctonia solani TaxID=456999 RepID=A0A8H3E6I2_9AGAM|nr:unnamed protein product [Rhizoctonia solani]
MVNHEPLPFADSELTGADDQTSANQPIATKRHPRFYFDDTLLVIQVEDTLFKVHQHQLLKSETFSDMLKMPQNIYGNPEEGSPEHPIVLKGVSVTDFEALMTVLYTSHFSCQKPAPEASLLIPASRLANIWGFSDLYNCLLSLAETVLGDVDKIVFAREFGLPAWLGPAHKNLCERPEPITTEEARKLGIDSLLLISRLREQFRPPKPARDLDTSYCESCAGVYHSIGTITCASCRTRMGSGYHHKNFPHSASTRMAISEAVNQWIVDGCVLKERNLYEPVIEAGGVGPSDEPELELDPAED